MPESAKLWCVSKPRFDLSVYFIVDPSLCLGRDVVDIVRAAVAGGATMIQYRDKVNSKDVVSYNARVVKSTLHEMSAVRKKHVAFVVNDYVDVALEIGADGVHLGQGDMSPEEARRVLGPDAIIGQTAFTPQHLAMIDQVVVDYAGTGPVYPTQTDKGKPVLGIEKFKDLVQKSPVPVVGVGGITPENAAPVIAAGASGVAMMRAISEAQNPKNAAQKFVKAVL